MSGESPRLLALMEQQDRVLSRGQALHGGAWQPMLPGVYLAATGTVTQAQRAVAAALYGGPGSVITGAAALRYHRLPAPESGTVDVLVPLSVRRQSVSYAQLHRTARMPG